MPRSRFLIAAATRMRLQQLSSSANRFLSSVGLCPRAKAHKACCEIFCVPSKIRGSCKPREPSLARQRRRCDRVAESGNGLWTCYCSNQSVPGVNTRILSSAAVQGAPFTARKVKASNDGAPVLTSPACFLPRGDGGRRRPDPLNQAYGWPAVRLEPGTRFG